MSLSVQQFVAAAQSAGVITRQELDSLISRLPLQRLPDSVDELAKALESYGRLTRLQHDFLTSGKGSELQFGEYVLLDQIGIGGMGVVYRAIHRRMRRLAAIKTLRPDASHNEDLIARFRREVEVAARLTHPNIVAAHDAGEARGILYLATEYVDGVDLAHVIERERRLSLPRAVGYILQAAHGLAYAHQAGVIHRDIKPANLMLDREGVVKILDMGLARLTNQEASPLEATDRGLTKTSMVMGTADYLAPEQARNSKHADERSDIYSLGATLYRLAVGSPLFSGETLVEKLLAHREDPVPSLRIAIPDCPPEVDAIFHRMVAKSPDDRFQKAAEVIVRLEAAMPSAHDATVIRPSETLFIERDRAQRITQVTPGIDRQSTLLDTPGRAGKRATPDTQPEGAATASRRRRDAIVAGSAVVVAVAALAAVGLMVFRPPPGPYGGPPEPVVQFSLPRLENPIHVDLLALFRPTDSPSGNWHREALGVSSWVHRANQPFGTLAVLSFPINPPPEYDLTLEIESLRGPGPILIALVTPERQGERDRDPNNDQRAVAWLDWRPVPPPGFTHPDDGKREPDLIFSQRSTVICRVRKNGIECNGHPINSRRDSILGPLVNSFGQTPNNSLFVATVADYRITRAVLSRPDDGEPDEGATTPPADQPAGDPKAAP